jgi:eukaryotic-like serine/threonine-protein kinase
MGVGSRSSPPSAACRDIFTIDAGGDPATVVQVTNDTATDWNPVWSPDGTELYFASDRDGTMTIWRIGIDEDSGRPRGTPQRVPTPASYAGFISLSGDGTRMVFQSRVESGSLQRLAFDPVTERTSPPEVLLAGSMFVRTPATSPDGKWIAFIGRAPYEDVYVMRSDGTDIRQLTNDVPRDRGPSWWPDGSRIIFYSNRRGEYQAWTVRPDGSGLTQLSDVRGGMNFPVVSPDGRWLAFIGDGTPSGGILDLSHPLPVKTYVATPNPPSGRFLPRSWSPDGRRIAGGTFGQPSLHVYEPGTKRLETLPIAARGSAFIDDKRLLVADSSDRVSIIDTETRLVKTVGALPPNVHHRGSVTAERRSVLVYGLRVEGDIWAMTIQQR